MSVNVFFVVRYWKKDRKRKERKTKRKTEIQNVRNIKSKKDKKKDRQKERTTKIKKICFRRMYDILYSKICFPCSQISSIWCNLSNKTCPKKQRLSTASSMGWSHAKGIAFTCQKSPAHSEEECPSGPNLRFPLQCSIWYDLVRLFCQFEYYL